MKILFYSNQLSERGTETALIDYAIYNVSILHNESALAFPSDRIESTQRYDELKKQFTIFTFSKTDELIKFYRENNFDLLYLIVDGEIKDISDDLPNDIKTFVHCVFSTRRKHGTYYCTIHPFLNKFYHTHCPVLPHIVHALPETKQNLKKELNIPKDAIVFGSYAGKHSFNIHFAQKAIVEAAEQNKNIYFIFMNIYNFAEEEFHKKLNNIIFLPGSTDSNTKAKFINTTDAMIHARSDGETFGLSVAEFSLLNKPIVTYKPTFKEEMKDKIRSIINKRPKYSEAHLMELGKNAITYSNEKQLYKILTNFNCYSDINKNYDFYGKKYSPENVMKQFYKIISGGAK